MSADDGMRRSVVVHGTIVPANGGRALEEARGPCGWLRMSCMDLDSGGVAAVA